ncbi:MAG: High-affinity branched-chain amino acid transport ATP-binding protein LivF [Alphaproteobacteria bacterium MarineAlpha9_Bin5]|mgnify:FL=1|jgi:branched-chain amino acid transport system ATP-binding protein|nr:MAG: High-affinity branched-chain amino acid transport ATP-binding protein LivF [Alphaproteobacteria bacterium MarineAlpha9_Bin6]PPR39725.1 MAG: High-affinity branched-chain amino acid transport ATP-binding protein LivF [Alphaproteobacteria bacterium MarineAlpha9_Bin5]HHZ67716.1 ATP-binding cassette domain-containing protein [Alphaproteobacteria bacterium]HIA21110.1 ATP-binding cassette domain-containing protein [Alphaproteobacteria bacterium]HIB19341.1 ATP-binding cassette domain-containing
MTLLIRDLEVTIAAAQILRGVSLDVSSHAMVGLIGRNGAGKTTFLRSVMGLIAIRAGEMIYEDVNLRREPAYRRANLGIGYMPEDRRLVPELTAEENVLLPAWATSLSDSGERLHWIYLLLPEVAAFADRKAIELSGGQQKLVALARALMVGRSLLLLDEPFEGVAPVLAQRLVDVLVKLKEEGLSVLLSESDASHSSNLVDRLYIIERGKIELG